ncbi:IS1634 family transposase [Kitasatospora sp. NPDC017646]|uniref:IS1634 family transposase n=1 Tax=Kitasatospora sp. NPDC017646 TaxID=3364024 RepID=UPI0037A3CE23
MVRYVQLATNCRADGTTKAEVLLNVGREDRLDLDSLRRLVASLNRYLGDGGEDAAAPLAVSEDGPLGVAASRAIGATWLLDGLWKLLGIDTALGKVLDARHFRTDVERALFALVANRAIAPDSKRAAVDWATSDVVIPAAGEVAEQHAYRAMDLLVDDNTQAAVQEAVFFAAANLLDLEVDVVFFDTTSTYFERDTPDPDGSLRRFGHSKDHRPDLPQIVIGLAVTREGIPVRCWAWPGSTNDQTVIEQVRADMHAWRLGRVVTVVDSGFSSEANLACLTRAGGHYIAGIKMRDGSAKAAEALARQGRYQHVRDNLRVKEVRLASDPTRRWIICHNPAEAERDATRRTEQLAAIENELARIKTAREQDAARARARAAKVKGGVCDAYAVPTQTDNSNTVQFDNQLEDAQSCTASGESSFTVENTGSAGTFLRYAAVYGSKILTFLTDLFKA